MRERKYLNLLREDMRAGHFGGNGQLPTLQEMALRYDCSVSSIRQAVGILRAEGLLQSRSGKGIFQGRIPLAGHPLPADRRRIIGAVVLHDSHYAYLERCKGDWQERGWFILTYYASDDCQNPAAERKFLEQASRENLAGVIIAATPLEPGNAGLYQEMRRRGMKVAHLSHYCSNMCGESFFLHDYAAAGRLAVGAALQRRRPHVAMLVNNVTSPYMIDMANGVEDMVNGLRLPRHRPIVCEEWGPFTIDDEATKRRSLMKHLDELTALPDGTALLCSGPDMTRWCRRLLLEAGIFAQKDFLLLSLNNSTANQDAGDGAYFDIGEQLDAALHYAADETVDAQTVVQRYFAPEFRIAEGENTITQ